VEITKEQFELYKSTLEKEKVRGMKSYMTYALSKLSGLTYDEVSEITSNYEKLEKQFN
jgi:hypothetical protein